MSSIERLEGIVQNMKWIKNDIGMGRIQCAKLIRLDNEVILILAHAVINRPIIAKVKSIFFNKDKITVFYDGEFSKELGIKEFERYRKYVTEYEWNIIFEDECDLKLEAAGLISYKEIVYIDVYENKYNYNKTNMEELLLVPSEA